MKLYEYIIRVRDEYSQPLNKFQAAAGGAEGKVDTLNKRLRDTEGASSKAGSALKGLGSIALATFSVAAIVGMGKEVFDITAKFQKYDAVLTNTFQSTTKAAAAQKMLTEFAAKTPYSVDELIGSYQKLTSQGFAPSEKEMRKLGDLASSQGKSFEQLSEAMLDATTFEFERLKEFGIKSEQHGNKIKFTFKGISTEVDKNAGAVRKYLLSLGDMKGVAGGMEAISKTLGGQVSNLGDKFDSIKLKIGAMFSGDAANGIGLLSTGLDKIGGLIDYTVRNIDGIKKAFSPLMQLIGPSITALNGIFEKMKTAFSDGGGLDGIFNKIGRYYKFVEPLFTSIGKLFGEVIEQVGNVGGAIFDIISKNEKPIAGFVAGFVESFKQIADMGRKIFGALGDVITGVLTFDSSKFASAGKKLWSLIKENNPIANARAISKAVMAGYQNGFGKEVFVKDKGLVEKKDEKVDLSLPTEPGGMNSDALANKGIKDTIGGGAKATTINITVEKFVENMRNEFNSVQDGANEMEQMFLQMFNRVVAGANYAQGQ